MATVNIRVHQDIKQRLGRAAGLPGMSQSAIVRAAIEEKMEELEDMHVARERLAKPFQSISNDHVWKELGIEA